MIIQREEQLKAWKKKTVWLARTKKGNTGYVFKSKSVSQLSVSINWHNSINITQLTVLLHKLSSLVGTDAVGCLFLTERNTHLNGTFIYERSSGSDCYKGPWVFLSN